MGFSDFLSSIPVVGGLYDTIQGRGGAVPGSYRVDETAYQETPEQIQFREKLAQDALGLQPKNQYLDFLSNQVYGPQEQGPSAAQAMLQQSTNANMNQLSGAIGSTRGVQNPALLARQAANIASGVGQQGVNQAAALKAQEYAQNQASQLAKQQMLGQGLSQEAAAQMAKTQLYGENIGQQNAQKQELERIRAGVASQEQSLQAQANREAKQGQREFISNLGSGFGMMGSMGGGGGGGGGAAAGGAGSMAAAASDIRAKKDIAPASGETKNFLDMQYQKMLDDLTPYSYNYKNKENGSGPQLGVMAQDLERSPAGKDMVEKDKNGLKRIVPNVSTILGAQANLNERLNKIEGKGMNETPQGYLDFLRQQQENPIGQIRQGPNTVQLPPIDLEGTYSTPQSGFEAPSYIRTSGFEAPSHIRTSGFEAPSRIESVPAEAPAYIQSAPVEAPANIKASEGAPFFDFKKFRQSSEKSKGYNPSNEAPKHKGPEMFPSKIQSTPVRAARIPSLSDANEQSSKYLDYLMRNYNNISDSFNKRYS